MSLLAIGTCLEWFDFHTVELFGGGGILYDISSFVLVKSMGPFANAIALQDGSDFLRADRRGRLAYGGLEGHSDMFEIIKARSLLRVVAGFSSSCFCLLYIAYGLFS
jgi:hypothetical protein